jgi:peptidoglycan lytic transglycosylase D
MAVHKLLITFAVTLSLLPAGRDLGAEAYNTTLLAGLTTPETAARPGQASGQAKPPAQAAGQSASAPASSTPASSTSVSSGQVSPAQHQRNQQLIQSVEKAYQNGIANYREGHPAAAKANFDYAVDLMLASGLDLKGDPELSEEFDHIVDGVNTLELDALKQGNGLAPAAEPTPADVANAATFTIDPEIRAEAEASLKTTQSDLPLVMNDYVAGRISFFSKSRVGHGTIVASLNRAGRYRDMIQRVLKEEGVPQDLIYLAVAESGFRPQAINPKSGAGGMWQFMPWGVYGLERTGWYDERFDPEKATRAYAREMKKAYAQLGDWYLAIASYNWGTGNVQRAVQRTGYADFWELYRRNNLPLETKNYVPIILAAAIMAKNPDRYGLTDLHPDPPVVADTVTTHGAVDLRLVGDIVGAPVQEIAGLNPSLLRMTTPPDDSYNLHLPPGTKDLYTAAIAEIPENKRTSWRYHRVLPGETIEAVAHTYHVTPADLAFVNQLEPSAGLEGEDALIIPVAAPAASAGRNTRYRVEREDTLVTVADRFDVTTAQLRRWNHLRSSTIRSGQTLYVAEPAHISGRTSGKTRGRGSKHSSAAHTSAAHSSATRGTASAHGQSSGVSAHGATRSAKTAAQNATPLQKAAHTTSSKKQHPKTQQ